MPIQEREPPIQVKMQRDLLNEIIINQVGKNYKIIFIENTKAIELERYGDFNERYHQKYIGKTGYIVDHYVSDTNIFKDFKCIVVEVDSNGRPLDADWFHKDDFEEVII